MFRAEVEDVTGNVGTAVKRTNTLLGAVRFVAEVTKERWAAGWRIIHHATGVVLLKGEHD